MSTSNKCNDPSGTLTFLKQGGVVNSLIIKTCTMIGFIGLCFISATAFADPAASPNAAEPSVGLTIDSIAELNTAATKTDVVFIYLPSKGANSSAPLAAMRSAARTIEAKGNKCGFFTLKPGSRDYDQITAKVTLPAVLAMVKGRGTSTISGDITETKLVQGYVAASRTGGCGAGKCGSGCR